MNFSVCTFFRVLSVNTRSHGDDSMRSQKSQHTNSVSIKHRTDVVLVRENNRRQTLYTLNQAGLFMLPNKQSY